MAPLVSLEAAMGGGRHEDPGGATLEFTAAQWARFTELVKRTR